MPQTPNIGPVERLISLAAGGTMVLLGMQTKRTGRYACLFTAAELIRRGLTGRSVLYRGIGIHVADAPESQAANLWASPKVAAQGTVTVNRPRDEVYTFVRQLENLPLFMKQLESVTQLDDRRSLWSAQTARHGRLLWETLITEDLPRERLAWQSLGGVEHAGTITFRDATGGRGTEISVHIRYAPPSGVIGVAVAKLLRKDPELELQEDLFRMRQVLEAGTVITTEGQPRGGARPAQPVSASFDEHTDEKVDLMSEESFPASDAPAY
jgi:uncharacterized membrane protein